MTMRHLMNCKHSEEGWCLDCVRELWEEKYHAVIEAGKYEYCLQAAAQRLQQVLPIGLMDVPRGIDELIGIKGVT